MNISSTLVVAEKIVEIVHKVTGETISLGEDGESAMPKILKCLEVLQDKAWKYDELCR